MRKIKETFILCCAAALFLCCTGHPCFAQTADITSPRPPHSITVTTIKGKPKVIPPQKLHKVHGRVYRILCTGNSKEEVQALCGAQFTKETIIIPPMGHSTTATTATTVFLSAAVSGKVTVALEPEPNVCVQYDDGGCTTTDQSGHYSFDVPGGQRKIRFSGCGLKKQTWEGNINGTTSIDMRMPTATAGTYICGTVHGSPVTPGCVKVTLLLPGTCVPEVDAMKACIGADTKGHFYFEELSTGNYTVEVSDPRCGSWSGTCTNMHVPNSNPIPPNNESNCNLEGTTCQP